MMQNLDYFLFIFYDECIAFTLNIKIFVIIIVDTVVFAVTC
jgi:hypothetical protein